MKVSIFRRFGEEVQKYMAELEAKSYIVANPPPEAAGFRAAPPSPTLDPLAALEEAAAESSAGEPEPEPDSESGSPPPR